jgi:hypothetical protein
MNPEPRPAAMSDPGSGALPPSLGSALTDPEKSILLLVAPDASDQAARAAIRLAEARGEQGRDTVLVDASVTDPRLHRLLDVKNLEGLADVFLFGASLHHVMTRPGDRPFSFISTGPYVPEPSAVLESSRWDRIAGELDSDESLLMLYVAEGTPGLRLLSRRVGHAVVLGSDRAAETAASRLDASCQVAAVIDPSALVKAEPDVPAPDPEAETAPASGDPDAVEGAPAAAEPMAESTDASALTEPLVFREPSRRSRSARPLLLVALIIAAGVAAWFGYREFLAPPNPPPMAAADAPAPGPSPERGAPVETPIPVSVAVEAQRDLDRALQRVELLGTEHGDVPFYLAPVVSRDGGLYYRLLAGFAADADAGARLLQRLVDAGHPSAFDSWAIRPTELAFHLGEYDTRQEAAARVDSLLVQDIPTYVVAVRHDPGEPRYRVYGGAYENPGEARMMKSLLEEAGVEAPLVPRTGEPAA